MSLAFQIYSFCLSGSDETLKSRVTHRASGFSAHESASRLEGELKRSLQLSAIFAPALHSGALGEAVSTEGFSPRSIAADICDRIEFYSSYEASVPADPSDCISFAPKYVDWIIDDRKSATTRLIGANGVAASGTCFLETAYLRESHSFL